MKRLLIVLTAFAFSFTPNAYARDGADDPIGDDHGGRTPTSARPTHTPSDHSTPAAGSPSDGKHEDGHNEGWTKLRPISTSGISRLRARVRNENKRRESRVRAQIKLLIPNTSLGFTTNADALAATYLMRIENGAESTVTCTLSADDSREHSPFQVEFALDVRSKSNIIANKKGGCITAGDVTNTRVLPNIKSGSVVTASVVIAGQTIDVAALNVK